MNTSEQINELAAALATAQGSISAAKYDGTNPHLKNRYTTLSAVWDAIRKPLSDNGLAVVQVVDMDSDGMILSTRLMHSSGQYIEAVYPVTAGEARGISGAQAIGSALTYARRYSLTALIGVVSDDDDDGNSAGDQKPRSKPQPNKPAAQDQSGFEPEPGEDVWADWRNPHDAKAWAMTQGKFNHNNHMERAYEKVKADNKPANAREMWRCWYEYVMAHEPAKTTTDGTWEDIDAHGHDADDPQ